MLSDHVFALRHAFSSPARMPEFQLLHSTIWCPTVANHCLTSSPAYLLFRLKSRTSVSIQKILKHTCLRANRFTGILKPMYATMCSQITRRTEARRRVGFVLVAIFLVGIIMEFGGILSQSHMIFFQGEHFGDIAAGTPLKYTNVAIASTFGFHCDVYMTVAWTIQRLNEPLRMFVYAQLPLHHDFGRIIDDYGIYKGNYKPPSEFIHDVARVTAKGAIDMIILGTCEIECVFFYYNQTYRCNT